MAYTGVVRGWDLYWADPDYPVGSEQAGNRRPVLVVSNDGINAFLPVVTQIPLTKLEGKARRIYPFEGGLPKEIVGSGWTSIAAGVRTAGTRWQTHQDPHL